jgi:hypothetical protein
MGYYERTFRTIDELIAEMAFSASSERVVDIYEELKRIRRDICSNADTRHSFLVPKVTRALQKARARIAANREIAMHELQVAKVERDADIFQMCHIVAIVFAVMAFYTMIFSTGRV